MLAYYDNKPSVLEAVGGRTENAVAMPIGYRVIQ